MFLIFLFSKNEHFLSALLVFRAMLSSFSAPFVLSTKDVFKNLIVNE